MDYSKWKWEDHLPTPECIPVRADSGIDYCKYHNQQMAECDQQKNGNYCSACRDWHRKDYNCKKKN